MWLPIKLQPVVTMFALAARQTQLGTARSRAFRRVPAERTTSCHQGQACHGAGPDYTAACPEPRNSIVSWCVEPKNLKAPQASSQPSHPEDNENWKAPQPRQRQLLQTETLTHNQTRRQYTPP